MRVSQRLLPSIEISGRKAKRQGAQLEEACIKLAALFALICTNLFL